MYKIFIFITLLRRRKLNKLNVINFLLRIILVQNVLTTKITKSGKALSLADVRGPQPRWIGNNYFNSPQNMFNVN